MYKLFWAAGCLVFLTGCVTTEVAQFSPRSGQETIIRDGVPALVSTQPNSILLVRPAQREIHAGQNSSYVLALLNVGGEPTTFHFANVTVAQLRDSRPEPLKTYSYEALVAEERSRQAGMAILAGVAGGLNAAAAANAGYYNRSATVTGPYGTSHVRVSGFDPTAAQLAQIRASAENQAMMARTIETGRQNLDYLEQSIIKDNTVFPGEWYGGQLQFQPPRGERKQVQISVRFGADIHVVDLAHVQTR